MRHTTRNPCIRIVMFFALVMVVFLISAEFNSGTPISGKKKPIKYEQTHESKTNNHRFPKNNNKNNNNPVEKMKEKPPSNLKNTGPKVYDNDYHNDNENNEFKNVPKIDEEPEIIHEQRKPNKEEKEEIEELVDKEGVELVRAIITHHAFDNPFNRKYLDQLKFFHLSWVKMLEYQNSSM